MRNLISGEKRLFSIIFTAGIGLILGEIISTIFPWKLFGGTSAILNSFLVIGVVIYYCKLASIEVPKRSAGVLTFLGKRQNVFLDEGFWGILVPGIFGVEPLDIKEITLGKEGDKYVEAKCLSRDRVEMSVAWSAQLQIIDPISWFNTKEPIDAVNNKFLSQLRIAIDLFVSTDFNQLKGVVSGLFSGKSYAVFRLPGGYLLQDRHGSIIAEEIIGDDRETAIDEVIRRANGLRRNLKSRWEDQEIHYSFEDTNGDPFDPYREVTKDAVETIPPSTFRYEDLNEEAHRVGAEIHAPAIKDVTPPPKVMKAWEDAEIERAQKKARERENEAHLSIALNIMGFKENEDRSGWSQEKRDYLERLMTNIRIQEENTDEHVVRVISTGASGDIGDKIIAAASLANNKSPSPEKKKGKKTKEGEE